MFVRSLTLLIAIVSCACISTREVFPLGDVSPRATPASGTPSYFICWNVHKASDERFTREVKGLLDTIPKHDSVILCMQEVRSSTYDLIKNLPREKVSGHYAPSWHLPFSKRSTGVLTVTNQSLPEGGVVSLKAPRRELYVTSPKVSLLTEMPLADGRNLQIINCHGLNFVPVSVIPKQLDEIFAALRDPDAPTIVCGDFNVWSEQRLQILRQKAREAGLAEAAFQGAEHSPAPQWLRGLKRINGFDPNIRLDRIYTRGIDVIDCHCQVDSISSDHLPMILKYRIRPAS